MISNQFDRKNNQLYSNLSSLSLIWVNIEWQRIMCINTYSAHALKYWFSFIPPTIPVYLYYGCAEIMTHLMKPSKSCREMYLQKINLGSPSIIYSSLPSALVIQFRSKVQWCQEKNGKQTIMLISSVNRQ